MNFLTHRPPVEAAVGTGEGPVGDRRFNTVTHTTLTEARRRFIHGVGTLWALRAHDGGWECRAAGADGR